VQPSASNPSLGRIKKTTIANPANIVARSLGKLGELVKEVAHRASMSPTLVAGDIQAADRKWASA
jgi:hypothetical protein